MPNGGHDMVESFPGEVFRMKRTIYSLAIGLLLGFAALAGSLSCGGPAVCNDEFGCQPQCVNQGDCSNNQTCYNGGFCACFAGQNGANCTDNSDCGAGDFCNDNCQCSPDLVDQGPNSGPSPSPAAN